MKPIPGSTSNDNDVIITRGRNDTSMTAPRAHEYIKTHPQTGTVRVWTLEQKEGQYRRNLVEFAGESGYHLHPDARHSLTVIEGRLCVWYGTQAAVLEPDDYFSVPSGMPHKYRPIGGSTIVESYDAPYYDPEKTQEVSENGVEFAPCPCDAE